MSDRRHWIYVGLATQWHETHNIKHAHGLGPSLMHIVYVQSVRAAINKSCALIDEAFNIRSNASFRAMIAYCSIRFAIKRASNVIQYLTNSNLPRYGKTSRVPGHVSRILIASIVPNVCICTIMHDGKVAGGGPFARSLSVRLNRAARSACRCRSLNRALVAALPSRCLTFSAACFDQRHEHASNTSSHNINVATSAITRASNIINNHT